MRIKIKRDGKYKEYSVRDYDCKKKECFIPFSGNGRNICRGYELGLCPKDKGEIK